MESIQNPPYNAKGDGIAEDTSAFQLAVDKGGHFFIPPGTYVINSVEVAKSVGGVTGWKSVIFAGVGKDSMLLHKSGATKDMFRVLDTTIDALTFRDIGFDGNNSNQIDLPELSCVRAGKASRGLQGTDLHPLTIRLENIFATNICQGVLMAYGPGNSNSHRFQIQVSNSHFVRILEGGDSDSDDKRTYNPSYLFFVDGVVANVSQCYFDLGYPPQNNGASAVIISTTNKNRVSANRFLFTGNHVRRLGRAPIGLVEEKRNHLGAIDFYADNEDVRVTQNTFTNLHGSAIRGKTSAHHCIIMANTIRDVASNAAISLNSSVTPTPTISTNKHCIISCNTVDMVRSETNGYGIWIEGLETDPYQDVQIANNLVYNIALNGIQVKWCRHVKVKSNHIRYSSESAIYINRCDGAVDVTGNFVEHPNRLKAIRCVGLNATGHVRVDRNDIMFATEDLIELVGWTGVFVDGNRALFNRGHGPFISVVGITSEIIVQGNYVDGGAFIYPLEILNSDNADIKERNNSWQS